MVEEGPRRNTTLMEEIQLCTNWDDVTCPICLDYPHNSVLLQCSSYDKGCRPFVCDTDHLHSNCLDRFKEANGMLSGSQSPSSADNLQFLDSGPDSKPACPLCRGEVTGWIVVDKARVHLDVKNRCCEEAKCSFTGTYLELQKHAQVEHPHACPSKIDPARQLDWENFQQSSEIIDVLSTIHSEVPHGVVLGDYVIEYGDDNSGDDFDEFRGDERNWWTSCILYQIFENFRTSRNRRRSRVSDSRRGNRRLTYDTSNSGEVSVSSIEYAYYNADDVDGEFAVARELSRGRAGQRSSRRRRSRFYDN
ncbi:uncharacterized protein LOC105160838 [Sesamum indicum]|uniref:Uncharacterized protein LOC105160838 n=1 Tax=Sesamum indicum TaxID=4182 RepID=A0A8M8V5S5_SESIN|nr:uncharacterized protein LOC105160838 [Sesamum indicum]XP_020551686.1 uncharacterized protein LOC105160838 [Sesamum indicum]XP_020551689.1 uncharacterized protein LOC105160838 [Sesamum indicum]